VGHLTIPYYRATPGWNLTALVTFQADLPLYTLMLDHTYSMSTQREILNSLVVRLRPPRLSGCPVYSCTDPVGWPTRFRRSRGRSTSAHTLLRPSDRWCVNRILTVSRPICCSLLPHSLGNAASSCHSWRWGGGAGFPGISWRGGAAVDPPCPLPRAARCVVPPRSSNRVGQ
jgi:hypothetical protein